MSSHAKNFKLPSLSFNLWTDADKAPDLDFFLSSLLALTNRSCNFRNAFSTSSPKIKKIISVIRSLILKKSLKRRVAILAYNFNKKWTPTGIFQGFCLDFKLFCLNELFYRYFSRVSRICISRNTCLRLLLVQANLIFQDSPFSYSRSSATFCHGLLFISFLWKCEWDLS